MQGYIDQRTTQDKAHRTRRRASPPPSPTQRAGLSQPKDAPLQQVCLDGFHGTRRGPHKRNTVCIGAHAPELPAHLVESRAAPIQARTGQVAKHQQHRHSACRSSRGVASSARGHRAHREALRTWFVKLFPKEGSLHRGGLRASLRSGFLLPYKNPASCVSKRQVSRLSVMDAGHLTFSAGVPSASTRLVPSSQKSSEKDR